MKNLTDVEAFWTEQAATFDESPDHGLRDENVRAAWAARLASWMPDEPGVVVDLGCGTGSLSLLAADLGASVRGVDLSAAMVEIAREKAAAAGHTIEFEVGDVSQPSMADRSVDVIVCRHLLWALPDPHAALRRWAEILRDDGRLILIEGVWSTEPVGGRESEQFPWRSGVSASRLLPVLEPVFSNIDHASLSESADLWGERIETERYAVVARGLRSI